MIDFYIYTVYGTTIYGVDVIRYFIAEHGTQKDYEYSKRFSSIYGIQHASLEKLTDPLDRSLPIYVCGFHEHEPNKGFGLIAFNVGIDQDNLNFAVEEAVKFLPDFVRYTNSLNDLAARTLPVDKYPYYNRLFARRT